MESERPAPSSAAAPGRALVRMPSAAAAARRVAGMSVAGRIAAEAFAAGIADLAIELASGERLPAAVVEDAERVGGGQLRLSARAGAEARAVLSGDFVAEAGLLRRFLASGCGTLSWNGFTVAEASGRAGEFATSSGVIPLADAREAKRLIVAATAKASDGIIARLLNRPVSQRLSSLALAIPGIRPWHLTAATAITLVVMFFLLLRGGHDSLIIGGVLFHVASVLDGCDGEIARAAHRSSVSGARLDTLVDASGNLLFMLGLGVGLTRHYGIHYAYVGAWGLGAGLAGWLMLGWLVRRIGSPGDFNLFKVYYRSRFPTGTPRRIIEAIVTITSRDFFAFGFALFCLAGEARMLLWFFAGITTFWMLAIAAVAPAMLRDGESLADWRRRGAAWR